MRAGMLPIWKLFRHSIKELRKDFIFFFSLKEPITVSVLFEPPHTLHDATQLHFLCSALCCGGALLLVPNSHAVIHAVGKRHLESYSLLLFLSHNVSRGISHPLPLLTFQRAAFVLDKYCLVPKHSILCNKLP